MTIYEMFEKTWSHCERCGGHIGDLEALTEAVIVQRSGRRVGIAHRSCAKEGTMHLDKRWPTRAWVEFDDEDTFEPPLLDFGGA